MLILADYDRLYRLINYVVTAFINQGYSKAYLFRFASNNFGTRFRHTFTQAFARFRALSHRQPSTFRVVFRWQHTLSLSIPSRYLLTEGQYNDFRQINNKAAEFLSRYTKQGFEYICLAKKEQPYQ